MGERYIITINRGYGSRGKILGRALAQELGISFYDRELLRLASDESGINEALFAEADEKLKGTRLFSSARKVYKGELIPPDRDDFISNENLFNYQAKVLKDLAQEESYVVMGRCADFVLKDEPNVVRIFVHAPFENCLETLRDMYHQSPKQLEKLIREKDKRRAAYYNYFTGQRWDDARNYDLCMNSAELTIEEAISLVKAFLEIKVKKHH
ncbi:MAG: AAA family ATPase [Lachnospiraceae bacterium]